MAIADRKPSFSDRAEISGCDEQRAQVIMERDRVQQHLSLALDVAVEGGAVARAWSGRIAVLQTALETMGVLLAEIDGRLAAAAMTEADCDALMAGVIEDAARLATLDWDTQQKHLRAWVRQVRLSPEVIEADLYVPALAGQVRTNHSEWVP